MKNPHVSMLCLRHIAARCLKLVTYSILNIIISNLKFSHARKLAFVGQKLARGVQGQTLIYWFFRKRIKLVTESYQKFRFFSRHF